MFLRCVGVCVMTDVDELKLSGPVEGHDTSGRDFILRSINLNIRPVDPWRRHWIIQSDTGSVWERVQEWLSGWVKGKILRIAEEEKESSPEKNWKPGPKQYSSERNSFKLWFETKSLGNCKHSYNILKNKQKIIIDKSF